MFMCLFSLGKDIQRDSDKSAKMLPHPNQDSVSHQPGTVSIVFRNVVILSCYYAILDKLFDDINVIIYIIVK